MTRTFFLPIVSLLPAMAFADAHVAECNFATNSGRLSVSYELIGVDACIAYCTGTEDCGAWVYTPHTFDPDTAPGQCSVYAEASDRVEPNATAPTQYCGQME